MTLNLATLNVRGLRDSSKCTHLLGELKNLGVDVAPVQETQFTCGTDCWVLENDVKVFSAYGSRASAGVSLLVGHSLDADVDVVFDLLQRAMAISSQLQKQFGGIKTRS